jgi:hypothetical protein
MTAIFSTFFRTQLAATPTLMDSARITMLFFREAPSFSTNDPRYIGFDEAEDLFNQAGWVPAAGTGLPLASPASDLLVSVRSQGINRYVMWSQYLIPADVVPVEVKAVAFVYKGTIGGVSDPVILISNTPFGDQREVIKANDGITSAPDPTLSGSNRWLFSWAIPAGGQTTVQAVEGTLALTKSPPAFETSHTQHVWVYPQRANMIANPSFEAPGTNYWACNRTITRVADPAPLGDGRQSGGAWAGKFAGAAPIIIESNVFPTSREEYWTVQFMAKGTGTVKVGLVWWDDDYAETAVDWGSETWTLNPGAYIQVVICRTLYQTYQAMLRIEVQGTDITLDRVLVERGFLKDWPYFDGGTTYGARDDFSWYGGTNRQGASYSLWYNNKRATYGRLFHRDVADDVLLTDEVEAEQGKVYQWVPAGTIVVPHIDVLYPDDLQAPVIPKTPGVVLPYRSNIYTDYDKVLNPWV